MTNMRSLRGMSVVMGDRPAGRVLQICLSDDLRRLDGIWVDAGLKGVRFVDSEHICVVGKRALIVDAPGERVRIKPCPLFLRAVSTAGVRLGAIRDAEIDEVSLTVVSLVLSLGYFEDFTRGEVRVTDYVCDIDRRRVLIPDQHIDSEV